MSTRKSVITVVLCLILLAVLSVLVLKSVSAESLRTWISGFGPLAPLAYIAAFTLLPAAFFPVAVLAVAGGLLFGLWLGSLYTFIGAILNCSLMFLLSRFVGHARVSQLVEKKFSPKWRARLSQAGGSKGFLLLFILRLIPAVPYNLINYAFGLTDMRMGTYLLASAIGIIPGTFVFINLGDKALDVTSPSFWLAVLLIAALLIVTTLLGKVLFPDKKRKSDKNERTEQLEHETEEQQGSE
ncbi:MAG: VTT domain-containing protein [Clostridiaceae bacterium]